MVNFRANKAIIITTSYFTKNARLIGERNPQVELWDGNTFKNMVRKYMINIK